MIALAARIGQSPAMSCQHLCDPTRRWVPHRAGDLRTFCSAHGGRSSSGAAHLPVKTVISIPLNGFNATAVLSEGVLTGTELGQLSCFVPRIQSTAPSRIRPQSRRIKKRQGKKWSCWNESFPGSGWRKVYVLSSCCS